ncbi:MAG: hypothetical protein BGO01_14200 [Armatimonadetes bacterium 55-13]|nr:hypothetical protein [Armatimonadota bacterium]OJU64873.1 MAG: hypothetical protein BGO01_14200 [Armatimonadetes bacterium 55-13]
MPFFWLPAPPSIPLSDVAQASKPQLSAYGEELKVDGKVREIDLERKVEVYRDGVVATFGPTVIKADRLELHYAENEQFGIATGNVHLDDPEGQLDAHSITFWWGKTKGPDGQIAVADNVLLKVGNITGRAEYASIKPDRWEFTNVDGTSCRRPLPLYSIHSKKVVFEPGRQGTIVQPRITILGKDLVTIPTRRFSLDKRSEGIQYPAVSYRSGLGLSWSSSLLFRDRDLYRADVSSFPHELPTYGLAYAHSFLPVDASTAKILPRSELAERFAWSYFDDVRVENIETSTSFATKRRSTLSAQTQWNSGSSARLDGERLSKALEVIYEESGPAMAGGLFWQARAQSIRKDDDPFITRAVLNATYQLPSFKFGRRIMTDVRLDGSGTLSEHGTFGWARAQLGLLYRPTSFLNLGGAFVFAGEAGNRDFISDSLYSKNALHLRGDINLGPTKISYLAKYDYGRNLWYDKEFSLSQVVGCLEPYLTRREFPKTYVIGIRLRLGEFLDPLQRRKQVRTKEPTKQIISEAKKTP